MSGPIEVNLDELDKARPVIPGIKIKQDQMSFLDIPCFVYKATEEGIYTVEYTSENIDHLVVYDKDQCYFQIARFDNPRKSSFNTKILETFYFEKGSTYYFCLIPRKGRFSTAFEMSFKALEVPSHNLRENAQEWDINNGIVNEFLYEKDIDWYRFKVPTDGEYKFVYSRLIDSTISIYMNDNSYPELASTDKITLMDTNLCEEYMLYNDVEYFMSVAHGDNRKLAKYEIKLKPSGVAVTTFDRF